MIVPSGRKTFEELNRNEPVMVDIIDRAQRVFRLCIGKLKSPLTIKFNYIQDIPMDFKVEISYSERIQPILESFRCPDTLVFKSEVSKDIFEKNYIFVKLIH